MKVSFDIDDFLAYLLSGSLMLVAFFLFFPQMLSSNLVFQEYGNGMHITVLAVMVTSAIVLLLGHISSIINRYVIRYFTRLIVNPREKIFHSITADTSSKNNKSKDGKENNLWYSPSLKKRIYEQFEYVFCYQLTIEENDTSPRLIRSYVLNNYDATLDTRKRIVRARSLCGNSIFPFLLLATYFLWNCELMLMAFSLVIASLLLVKQMDLDEREWKEIYTAFAARK